MKKGMKDIFSNLMFIILKIYIIFTMIYPFLPEKRKIENVKKHLAYLHDSSEYVIHTRNLKQALNHGLVLKKFHRVIKFNPNSWLKPYIYIYM